MAAHFEMFLRAPARLYRSRSPGQQADYTDAVRITYLYTFLFGAAAAAANYSAKRPASACIHSFTHKKFRLFPGTRHLISMRSCPTTYLADTHALLNSCVCVCVRPNFHRHRTQTLTNPSPLHRLFANLLQQPSWWSCAWSHRR